MRTSTSDSASPAKRRIRAIVSLYRSREPEEYGLLVKAVDMHRKALADPKFARSDRAGEGMRGLYEVSEALQAMLVAGLSLDELTWLKSVQGGRWFASTYGEFALPSHV